MADRKGWGSTVIGWFVVQDPVQDAEAAPEATAAADGAAAVPSEPLDVFQTPPPAAPGGAVDFDQVFAAAGIDDEARQRVARTQELIDSLPADTDEKVKQQIVLASLRAFAVPVEKIIESGAQQLQALEAYIRTGARDTELLTSDAEQRIKQFEEEIVKLRRVMQERVDEQQAVIRACNGRKLEVQKVLEFFGQEAVSRVVRESPNLREPGSS